MDLDKILAGARRVEDIVPICLRGDLLADIASAERRLQATPEADAATRTSIAEHIQSLRAQMADATIEVRMRAMGHDRWIELVDGHPPRDDSDGDKTLGFNQATFVPTLIRESVVDPEFNDAQLAKLLAEVNDHQYVALSNMAWNLNRRGVDIPFSFAASQILTSSGSE